ncbi:MAG TPA: hypothetical protein DCM86_01295 [Verrucomicrobiales bacterium]|nr:hypothetical protein [Verrucomicrobiales bacterium]
MALASPQANAQLTQIDIYPPGNPPASLGSYTTGAGGSFTITSDGAGFPSNIDFGKGLDNTGDVMTFAAETVTGDFDRSVEITSIAADNGTDAWTRGALMARVPTGDKQTAQYSASLQIVAGNPALDDTGTPKGANQAWFTGRALDGQNYTSWGRGLPGVDKALPHQWLRLRRVGDYFSAYVGTNGASWTLIGQRYQALPATLLVGPYAASGTAGVTATVKFTHYGVPSLSDVTAPTLVSAGTLDKKVVGVRFSEAVSSATATATANYQITQTSGHAVTINSIKLGIGGDSAYLSVSGLDSDTFTVKVIGGVKDTAGNPIAANTSVAARALNWAHEDLGLVQDPNNRPTVGDDPGTVGQAVMVSSDDNPEIEIVGGGSNAWNPGDFIHYIWRKEPLSGDFDVTIAVQRNDRPANTAGWANSGLMLRAAAYLPGQEYTISGTKVPMVANTTYIEGSAPGRGAIPLWRTTEGGGYGNGNAGFGWNQQIGYVKGYYSELRGVDASGNVDPISSADSARYLRIKRVGTTYTFYASWDRSEWALVDGPVNLPDLPDQLLLGFSTMNDTGSGAPPHSGYGNNGHQIDPADPYNPANSGGAVQNDSNYSVQRIKVFPNGVPDPLPGALAQIDVFPPGNAPANIGTYTKGANGSFTITSDGTGFFSNINFGTGLDNTGDVLTFVAETVTGDFDRSVEVTGIAADASAPQDVWTRAALMARVPTPDGLTAHYSASLHVIAANPGLDDTGTPKGANQVGFAGRALDGQNYTWWGRNLPGVEKALPHQWLRLRRVGDYFSAYVGTNGINWTLIGQRYQALPSTLLVGPYASSGAPGVVATATFDHYRPTILSDKVAPTLVSAGTLDKKVVGVRFSEAISSATAVVPGNYQITQPSGHAVTISSIKLGIGGDAAYLSVSGLDSDSFTVKVIGGIKDTAGNAIAANSSVSARALNWAHEDIGLVQDPNNRPSVGDDPGTVGQAVMVSSDENPEIEIVGGGSNAWNPGDFIHYIWRKEPLSGNFDVTIAVTRNDRPANTAGWANSGLMLRAAAYLPGQEFTVAGSKVPMVANTTYLEASAPGRGAIPLWRTSEGGGYGNGNAGFSAQRVIGGVKGYYSELRGIDASGNVDPQSAPDTARYLRIKRVGTTYTFYASWNRTDWALVDGPIDLPQLPDQLLLGFSTMNDTGSGSPPHSGYGNNGHQIDPADPYNPANAGGSVQNDSNYSVQRIKVFPNGVTDPLPVQLTKVDIRPTDGSSVALGGTWTSVGSFSFDMSGGGTGAFRNMGVGGDELTFAYENVTGDFDKQVAVKSLTTQLFDSGGNAVDPSGLATIPADAWARAGLMARVSDQPSSAGLKLVVANPAGANVVRVMGRGLDGQNYTMYSRDYSGVTNVIPNQYIRMKRVGNSFTFYVSHDGVVWAMVGETYQELPATLMFGTYVASSLNPSDTKGNPDGLLGRAFASFTSYKDVDLGDLSGPVLVSAGTLDKKTIGVKFSEAVSSATATVAGNYTLSQGTVTGARIGIGGDTVYLTVKDLTANTFTVSVKNVTDTAGNAIGAGASVAGKASGWVSADIGLIQDSANRPTPGDDPYRPGQAVATSSDDAAEVEIIGGGSNAWNPGDFLHYLYSPTPITGDFDVAAKVTRNDRPNNTAGWANSGLMLRSAVYNDGEDFTIAGTQAPMVANTTYIENSAPGRGAIPLFRNSGHGGYGNGNAGFGWGNLIGDIKGYYPDLRATDAAGTIDPASSPNSARWLRIQRTGATYTFYVSWDGINWALLDTRTDITIDGPLLLGFSSMNDTGSALPPHNAYGGNGHDGDDLARNQNESNYSVQKVRIYSNVASIGVATARKTTEGRVSISYGGTLLWSASLNGPWARVASQSSPYVVSPSDGALFFRAQP